MKNWLLLFIGIVLLCAGCYYIGVKRAIMRVENDVVDTITIYDTISDLKADTIWLDRYDTLEYYQCDTIWENGEIVFIEDTIQVPVPISKSIYSDTLKTDTTKFSYRMLVEGYNVTIDSLSYHFEYNPPIIQKKSQQRLFFGLAVGVTYYEGVKPCIGVGIGYKLF